MVLLKQYRKQNDIHLHLWQESVNTKKIGVTDRAGQRFTVEKVALAGLGQDVSYHPGRYIIKKKEQVGTTQSSRNTMAE